MGRFSSADFGPSQRKRDEAPPDQLASLTSEVDRLKHELTEASLPTAPGKMAFYRALSSSKGCVSLVDEQGESYERVWCDYEAYLALSQPCRATTQLAVYTASAHAYTSEPGAPPEMRMAVGLLEGLAKDPASERDGALESWQAKLRREAAFPKFLLRAGMLERSGGLVGIVANVH